MLNLGAILTVVLASFITSRHGSPVESKDIADIFKLLKEQQYVDLSKDNPGISASDSSSDEDSANNSIYGVLKNMEVIDLIEKANKEKSIKSQKGHKNRINTPVYRNFEINRLKDKETQRIIEQLIQDKNTAPLKQHTHHRLTPNNLLSPFMLEHVGQTQTNNDLSEYSKIFVVLDPLAIQKSENQDALTNLISRILSLSSATNEKTQQKRNKGHRYKGFRVNHDLSSRRYRRESKESFGARDSMEEDYKQKRPRSDHAVGSGGRTAIPYIRQRGDIYEREHR